MAHRYSVGHWIGDPLQAASLNCGICEGRELWIGIDLIAQDGNTFAHGQFDLLTAMEFHARLGAVIEEARVEAGIMPGSPARN